MYQRCPKVNADESEALHFLHIHGFKVFTVFCDDEGKEGPAEEDNWEDDESSLILLLLSQDSPKMWDLAFEFNICCRFYSVQTAKIKMQHQYKYQVWLVLNIAMKRREREMLNNEHVVR